MRQTGVVLQYRLAAGFGFIKTSTGQSLFFHIKQVRDGFLLEPGDSVAFTDRALHEAGRQERMLRR